MSKNNSNVCLKLQAHIYGAKKCQWFQVKDGVDCDRETAILYKCSIVTWHRSLTVSDEMTANDFIVKSSPGAIRVNFENGL